MTEKQLRESLDAYLSPAGLPDSRKQSLLARIRAEDAPPPEKGEPNMFRPNKFRTALILIAALLVLSFTVALAAGFSGYVNFQGEPVDNLPMVQPTPMPTEGPAPAALSDEAFTEITNREVNTAWEYLVTISYEDEDGGGKGSTRGVSITAGSMEELVVMLGGAMELPRIPEGYFFRFGSVHFSCDDDSSYELVHEEFTPEGVCIRHYAIPEGEAVPTEYSLSLENAAGDIIYCWAALGFSNSQHHFGVSEEDTIQTPAVPGMDDALLISRPDSTRLSLRRTLDEPIPLWSIWPSAWERWPIDTYETLEINVDSDTVPADVLLSMFGE